MAAGLGFKTFTTGEVLTAADTNGYLMQGVLVFASSAARAAAITSPQEGQYSYLKDTNSTEYYDGAAWIAAPIGDITAVSAGTGISVASGTGPVPVVTNSMATEITAAGDIIVGTGSGTFDNLPIGTTAQVLTADTTVSPYKVKWATPASGSGFTLIQTNTLSGVTSSSFNSVFTSTYTNYRIVSNITGTSAVTDLTMRLRASGTDNSSSNYRWSGQYNTSGVATPVDEYSNGTQTSLDLAYSRATGGNYFVLDIFAPQETAYTTYMGQVVVNQPSSSLTQFLLRGGGLSVNTAYDGFTILGTTNMTGTISVYGYGK